MVYSSVPLISERKGTDPHWKHLRCTHFGSARQPWRHCVTSLRSAHWLASGPEIGGVLSCQRMLAFLLLWRNGWMHQDATWYGGRPPPRRLCVRWGPSPPSAKGVHWAPKFSAHIYCGQTAAWIKMPLGTEVGVGLRDIVLHGDPVPLP